MVHIPYQMEETLSVFYEIDYHSTCQIVQIVYGHVHCYNLKQSDISETEQSKN